MNVRVLFVFAVRLVFSFYLFSGHFHSGGTHTKRFEVSSWFDFHTILSLYSLQMLLDWHSLTFFNMRSNFKIKWIFRVILIFAALFVVLLLGLSNDRSWWLSLFADDLDYLTRCMKTYIMLTTDNKKFRDLKSIFLICSSYHCLIAESE